MKTKVFLIILTMFLFYGCKKDPKPVYFAGQLLLSKKFPTPLANRMIEIYQPGSSSMVVISSGATAASTITNTDANGNFNVSFIPGRARFLIFSGANGSPVNLSNAPQDTAYPFFRRLNFPDSGYDANKPTYIGKIIDSAIIKVALSSNLTTTDTIGVNAYTIGGGIKKEYTGRSGNVGDVIVLDTIYNMLFTNFNCQTKKFENSVYAGRKYTTSFGYTVIGSGGVTLPTEISQMDETRQEIKFWFKK